MAGGKLQGRTNRYSHSSRLGEIEEEGGGIREREEACVSSPGRSRFENLWRGEGGVSFSLTVAEVLIWSEHPATVASTFIISLGKSRNSIIRLTSNPNTIESPRRKGATRTVLCLRMFRPAVKIARDPVRLTWTIDNLSAYSSIYA